MVTTTNQAPTARYEFRIFGDDCRAIGERVAQMAIKQGEDQSLDIYILASAVDDQNCKIRDGHLEVKTLLAKADGLEQWQPTVDENFPVHAAWLHEKFFPLFNFAASPLQRERYTPRQFLNEVVEPYPAFKILPVLKHRDLFSLQGCRVEVGTVHVHQKLHLYTIALEALEVPLVKEVRIQLGLQHYANTNYLQMIQNLV